LGGQALEPTPWPRRQRGPRGRVSAMPRWGYLRVSSDRGQASELPMSEGETPRSSQASCRSRLPLAAGLITAGLAACLAVFALRGVPLQASMEESLGMFRGSEEADKQQPQDSRSRGDEDHDVKVLTDSDKDDKATTTKLVAQEGDWSHGSKEWEVVYPGALNVRKEKDLAADVVSVKLAGTIVVGRQQGDWLALIREPGFMKMSLEGETFLKERTVSYAKLMTGSCGDSDLFPIYDANTCENAGFALGYFDTKVGVYHGSELKRPEGCYEFQGQLWLASNAAHIGRGAVGERKPICSSKPYPTTTTTTTTTSTTTSTRTTTRTTTSTTTWGFPSLFCIEVVRVKGYELPMVRAQQRARASIFTCDEYVVFSDGGVRRKIGVGPDGLQIMSIVIPQIKESMGNLHAAGVTTNSWLNTQTFLQVWDLTKKDGRFLHHDWTIKVDPDAVFFPERLRLKLKAHTYKDANLFFMNCDRFNPVAMYGSLEIFSRKALENYLAKQWKCRNELQWHGWGEDYFMSHCFDHIQVGRVYDFQLIGDKRCHYAPCSDTSKVVYHDYKTLPLWFQCWNMSRRSAGLI